MEEKFKIYSGHFSMELEKSRRVTPRTGELNTEFHAASYLDFKIKPQKSSVEYTEVVI